jgi:hypothetical protein
MKELKLNPDKIALELYKFLKPLLPELDVRIGARNLKDNDFSVIYCNTPVSVKDLEALGSTLVRIEIFNRKQKNGNEQISNTEKSGAVVRYGSIELYDMVLGALSDNMSGNTNLVIGDYSLSVKEVIKSQDKEFSYTWLLFNCTINY